MLDHTACCGYDHLGRMNPQIHELRWATIQYIRENTKPVRDHIVYIITDLTNKKHLYAAACMAKNKITIVGNMQSVEKALKKQIPQKKTSVLLEYTLDPSKRIK